MLPYQLVPQSEAASILPQLQQQQQRLRNQQRQLSGGEKPPPFMGATDTADSRRPLVDHVHNRHLGQEFEQMPVATLERDEREAMVTHLKGRKLSSTDVAEDGGGNQYTDSSLQYADDDADSLDEMEEGAFGKVQNRL